MGGDIPGIYKASQTSQAGQAAESSKSHGKFGRFSVVVGGGATTPRASKTDTSVTIGTVYSESIWDRFVDQFWETLGFFKGTSKSD